MAVPTRPRSPGTRPVLVMLALALLVTLGAGPATAAPNSGRAPRYRRKEALQCPVFEYSLVNST
jgi:hypothetical protein